MWYEIAYQDINKKIVKRTKYRKIFTLEKERELIEKHLNIASRKDNIARVYLYQCERVKKIVSRRCVQSKTLRVFDDGYTNFNDIERFK